MEQNRFIEIKAKNKRQILQSEQLMVVTNQPHAWWRHQMETFSAQLALCAGNSPVTGEFHAQRPVTRSFDVCFDLRLNKRLSAHYDVILMNIAVC